MSLWLPALVALVVTVAAMPLVRRELLRRELLDHPNARSSHELPTPRGGGIGCLVGLLVGGAVGLAMHPQRSATVVVVVSTAVGLGLIGLADDVGNLSARVRLAAQVALGLLAGGVVATVLGLAWPGWALLGAFATVLLVNTVNFMDGINGISGLTLLVWGVATAVLGQRDGADDVALLGALGAATGLGFLPFNIPVARMFLGDVGSYGIGGLVATTSVLALGRGLPLLAVVAPLVPYLADVLRTLAVRALGGRPLTTAHREHVYQLLTAPGRLAHPPVAAGAAVLAAVAAAAAQALPAGAALLVLLLVAAAVVGSGWAVARR